MLSAFYEAVTGRAPDMLRSYLLAVLVQMVAVNALVTTGAASTFRQVGIATGIAGLGAVFVHQIKPAVVTSLQSTPVGQAVLTHGGSHLGSALSGPAIAHGFVYWQSGGYLNAWSLPAATTPMPRPATSNTACSSRTPRRH